MLELIVIVPKEGRVRNIILRPFQVRANEEKDIEYRLQIMDNTMRGAVQKYLHRDERRGTLGAQSIMNVNEYRSRHICLPSEHMWVP